jgi:FkbM family methyltransferase
MDRHRRLKNIAHTLYLVPGFKRLAHIVIRLTILRLPISFRHKQRLYNFFGKDTSPSKSRICNVNINCANRRKSISLELNLNDDISRIWYYFGYQAYERGTTRLFRKLLSDKSCVFDVGANVGYYSFLAACYLEGRGEVHSFEPVPSLFDNLLRNAELNEFSCLSVNNLALSDRDGDELLYFPSDHAWSNASLVPGFTDQIDCIIAKSTRFDTYCRSKQLKFADLVKIDTEGAESKVLDGMGDLVDVWLPDIICEVLETFDYDIDQFFHPKPYHKFLITDEGLEPVTKIKAHPQFRDYYLSCSPIDISHF